MCDLKVVGRALLCVMVVFSMSCTSLSGQETDSEQVDRQQEVDELLQYPMAILAFHDRGQEVQGMGEKAADLLFANLILDDTIFLVERQELDSVLNEAELNLSGLVKPNEVIQVGQLTGAKLIVTGSVFKIDDAIYVVAKIISTETSRVVGASTKGGAEEPLDDIVAKLANEVLVSIKEKSSRLVADPGGRADQIADLKKTFAQQTKPSVFIAIEEQHVGQSTIDPAAEMEMMMIFRECGFTVVDSEKGKEKRADIIVRGEGISEFATRTKNLISAKARLEVKVVDRKSGKIIAVDRQTRISVDLSEQIAGKQALQQAASDIAIRLIPKIFDKED